MQSTPPNKRASGSDGVTDHDEMMVSLQSGVIKKLADVILKSDQFAQDGGGRLYRFNNGIYKPDGESRVKCQVKAFLNVPTMRTA